MNIKGNFLRDTHNRITAIKREIEINIALVQSIKSFYESSEEVTSDEFHKFTSGQLAEHRSVRALEWVLRVPGSERYAIENTDFQITEIGSDGNMVRAAEREEYFPVYYVEPFIGNEKALGFDLFSNTVRADALKESRDSGEVSATAQIELAQKTGNENGFLIFLPVYHAHRSLKTVGDRGKNLKGFVLGVFEIGDVIENALSYLQPRGIDLHIYDESTSPEGELLYSHMSRMRTDESRLKEEKDAPRSRINFSESLNVANRRWRITTEPIPIYYSAANDWHAWAISFSLLVIALVMTSYLRNMATQTARIQNLVHDLSDDISKRKLIEERLFDAHKRLLTILDGIDSLVYVADMDTYELLFVNKYGRDVWGNMQGNICWEVLQSDQSGPCEFCTNRYLLDPEGQPAEAYTWEFKNTVTGHWYYISDRAIRWIDGRLVRLEIASDITERKTLEEERQRSHKLESVGILAGGIAHDFNNLITAVMNNIYLSKRNLDSTDKAYRWLQQSEKALMRASDLTRQFLTFSKGGEPVRQSTSITEVIRESAEFILRGSNSRCEYSFADDLWPVEIDSGQISQVFQNLIINADQSMPDGGIIRISAENAPADTITAPLLKDMDCVKVTVQDQGMGISEEHLDKIFDPYFTTKDMGRGLGLAITFSIIKNHGGHILVETEPGRGAAFIIYLPATRKKPEGNELLTDAASLGEGKILIMDDEEMVRNSLGEIISIIGYDVAFARDGKEAMALYEKAMKSSDPFCAVILDLTVPGGMGGKEALQRLREIDPDVKAIVSSGYSKDPVMARFSEYGFLGVIFKPYRHEDLTGTLRNVLNE